jgi:hypothetical protein
MRKFLGTVLDLVFYGGLLFVWVVLIANALPVYFHVAAIARSAATLLTS